MQPTDVPTTLARLAAGDSAPLARAVASVLAATTRPDADRSAEAAVADTAQRLAIEAVDAGLSPDELFVVLEDAVRRHLTEHPPGACGASTGSEHALGIGDAITLLLWGAARRTYHDTRITRDATSGRPRRSTRNGAPDESLPTPVCAIR